jgi:hypothetical protein
MVFSTLWMVILFVVCFAFLINSAIKHLKKAEAAQEAAIKHMATVCEQLAELSKTLERRKHVG